MSSPDLGLCPLCNATVSHPVCVGCGASIGAVFTCRVRAWQLASEAARLIREGQIEEAYDVAADAVWRFPADEIVQLWGWLAFLSGDARTAERLWRAIPEEADRVARRFNEALALARRHEWLEVIRRLDGMDWPFLPGLQLRLIAEEADGRHHDANATRRLLQSCFPKGSLTLPTGQPQVLPVPSGKEGSDQSARPLRVMAGLVVLALGMALGAGTVSMWGSERAETVAGPPPRVSEPMVLVENEPGEPEGPAVLEEPLLGPLGRAILLGDAATLASGRVVQTEPLAGLGDLPAPVRHALSREWYLRAVTADGGDDTIRRDWFVGSLLMVGAASEQYWVDDALYALVDLASDEGEMDEAMRMAEFIVAHHSQGIFNNSRVRAILDPD